MPNLVCNPSGKMSERKKGREKNAINGHQPYPRVAHAFQSGLNTFNIFATLKYQYKKPAYMLTPKNMEYVTKSVTTLPYFILRC